MKMRTLKTSFGDIQVTFEAEYYAENNNLFISIIFWEDGEGEFWNDLTINLGKCDKNCGFINTKANGPKIIEWIIVNGLGYLTGRIKNVDYCEYPEILFVDSFIKEIGC